MHAELPAPAPSAAFQVDKYLDDHEAADLLGLSSSFLRKLRVTGGGPAYAKIAGRAVRYRTGDLLDWARSKTVRSTSERAVA